MVELPGLEHPDGRDHVADLESDRPGRVAEPGFLGMLRGALGGPTVKAVAGEVPKELTERTVDAISEHLAELLEIP